MLKITSGQFRGRLIHSLSGTDTRPTSERLRQAWLNALQVSLQDSRVLDLFSGSGALGLEAISRGASYVVFVESNPKASEIIQKNINLLGIQDQAWVITGKVEQILTRVLEEPPFDLMFMDPPYHQGYEEKILNDWPLKSLLVEHGKICIESARRKGVNPPVGYPAPQGFQIIRDQLYGESQLTFYQKEITLEERLGG